MFGVDDIIIAGLVSAAVTAAGSAYSAHESADAQSDLMDKQNVMNMENYKKRYQVTTEDMRKAGLNPILAATGGFSVGNSPQVQTHAPDMSFMSKGISDMANSAKSFFETDQIQEETKKIMEETNKIKNDADLSLAQAEKERSITTMNQAQAEKIAWETKKTGFDIKESMSRTQKNIAETDFIGTQKKFTEQKTEESRATEERLVSDIKVNVEKMKNLMADTMLIYEKGELTKAEKGKIEAETKNLQAQLSKLEAISDVYKTASGKYNAWIKEFGESLKIPGSGGLGILFKEDVPKASGW